MADGHNHAGADSVLNIARRLRPLRRQRYKTDIVIGGLLPTIELINGRRTNPALRMRAARTVNGRDVGTFNVNRFHCAPEWQLSLGPHDVA